MQYQITLEHESAKQENHRESSQERRGALNLPGRDERHYFLRYVYRTAYCLLRGLRGMLPIWL